MIKLGLRVRFFLYSNTVIIVTMTLVTVIGMVYERRVRYEGIVNHGRSVVDTMVISISDSLRPGETAHGRDAHLVENYISEIMDRSSGFMRYVVVSDTGGIVTHSSRGYLVDRPFDRALTGRSAGAATQVVEHLTEEGEDLIEVLLSAGTSLSARWRLDSRWSRSKSRCARWRVARRSWRWY